MGKVTFVDSNNTVYPYPAAGTADTFVAIVIVATAVTLAVDTGYARVYPIDQQPVRNAGTATYT